MGREGTRAAAAPTQVAAIPVRWRRDVEVCLIRRKDSREWGIPKGFIDPGHSPQEAALNEALEEAGLSGRVSGDTVGAYRYRKRGVRLVVAVFLMEVLQERERWQEMDVRERGWFSLDEATRLLADHPVRTLWAGVRKRLASASSE